MGQLGIRDKYDIRFTQLHQQTIERNRTIIFNYQLGHFSGTIQSCRALLQGVKMCRLFEIKTANELISPWAIYEAAELAYLC